MVDSLKNYNSPVVITFTTSLVLNGQTVVGGSPFTLYAPGYYDAWVDGVLKQFGVVETPRISYIGLAFPGMNSVLPGFVVQGFDFSIPGSFPSGTINIGNGTCLLDGKSLNIAEQTGIESIGLSETEYVFADRFGNLSISSVNYIDDPANVRNYLLLYSVEVDGVGDFTAVRDWRRFAGYNAWWQQTLDGGRTWRKAQQTLPDESIYDHSENAYPYFNLSVYEVMYYVDQPCIVNLYIDDEFRGGSPAKVFGRNRIANVGLTRGRHKVEVRVEIEP